MMLVGGEWAVTVMLFMIGWRLGDIYLQLKRMNDREDKEAE